MVTRGIMKLAKPLKLTLGAIAAIAMISSAQAASFFLVSAGSNTTGNISIPPNITSGSIFSGPGNTGTRFNFTLVSTISTSPGVLTTFDLLGVVSANGAGSITLCLGADGFTPAVPVGFNFVANSAGNTHAITLNDTLMINGGLQSASTDQVTLASSLSQGMSNTVTVTPLTSPFALENCLTITFGRGGGTVSFDKVAAGGDVPDGGITVSLLGMGLLAIGGIAKLRGRKSAG